MSKKKLVAEWGLKPWELDRVSAKFYQDVELAEHAEQYIQQQQREQSGGGRDSISHQEYDVGESRQRAFQ